MATAGPQSATHVRRPIHRHQARTIVSRTTPGKRSWPCRSSFRFPSSTPTRVRAQGPDLRNVAHTGFSCQELFGCPSQLDPVDERLEQSLRLRSIPTAAVHNAGGHAVVAVLHELIPSLPCLEPIPVNGQSARQEAVVVAGKSLRHSLRQKRPCLVFSPARVRGPDAACGSVVARDGR